MRNPELGRCEGCPIVGPACENAKNRWQAADQVAALALAGLSSKPDTQLPLTNGIQVKIRDLGPDAAQKIDEGFRQNTARFLNEAEAFRDHAEEFVEDCPGPTTARFRTKTGRLVEVTVCDNVALPWRDSGGENLEPVWVRRRL